MLRSTSGSASTVGAALVVIMTTYVGQGATELDAQEWRGRAFTRIQFVEARPLRLDSVAIGLVSGTGSQRLVGDTLVTCAPGASHCFFYGPGDVTSTAPIVQDLDFTTWGFGVEGLRFHVSTRFRTAAGDGAFWPRTDDHFDMLLGYAELERPDFRVRVGRDYQVSGLGFYGYDGGSITYRYRRARLELEAYGGWGLERGLPEPVTSDALASLEEFQPRDRNVLFGVRASGRPGPGVSFEAIYQREIETDRSGVASERVALELAYAPTTSVSVRGHADYDLATGWWGKAGATAGWSAHPRVYLEGRFFRYRPVFSLQTIWAAFSPTPYAGWGLAAALRPAGDLVVRLEGERRDYSDTEATVPFQVTTDRMWRASASADWRPGDRWAIAGSYRLDFAFGAALSAGDLALEYRPHRDLSVGLRGSLFQQLEEFRVGEGRVWSVGSDLRWRTDAGTIWASVDRYRHDRRDGGVAEVDWSQTRAALGIAVYLGSEPGRVR